MKMVRVGVDVDDTLADLVPSLCRYLNAEFDFNITPGSFRRGYRLSEVMGWPPGSAARYLRAHEATEEYAHMPAIEGSHEGVAELASRYVLHAVTARHEGIKELTLSWIGRNYPGMFVSTHFTNGLHGPVDKKTEVCKELGISVVVEDNPAYAMHLSDSGIAVVLLDRPWNEGVTETPRLKRAKGWKAAVPAVHEFAEAI